LLRRTCPYPPPSTPSSDVDVSGRGAVAAHTRSRLRRPATRPMRYARLPSVLVRNIEAVAGRRGRARPGWLADPDVGQRQTFFLAHGTHRPESRLESRPVPSGFPPRRLVSRCGRITHCPERESGPGEGAASLAQKRAWPTCTKMGAWSPRQRTLAKLEPPSATHLSNNSSSRSRWWGSRPRSCTPRSPDLGLSARGQRMR
jgi:hypothetical protein